ncbi:MAG TPA: peptidase M61 [Caulobacteraceae bacterium]|jgi:predicted metalloprotease with PDZ domain
MKLSSVLAATVCAAALCSPLAAASAPPQPATPAPPIAAPQDIPYPGVLRLAVDATDLSHAIFSVHETLPVQGAGPITLLYPKWLPGNHSPTGPIDKLAGLVITANGQRLEWRRDPVDVFAFHVDVPAGVSALDLDFQFLSPVSTREGRVVMTPDMLNVEWNAVALYPAGYFSRQINVQASVKLPAGFTPATALETASTDGATTLYKPIDFENLVDSPLIAGRNFKSFDLDPGGPARVSLDVITDRPDQLAAKADQIEAHKALVKQAYKLFASHHYDHYDFLLSLSDKMGGNGLEHHQSSEDGTIPKYFTDWDKTPAGRDLLAHEFTHSWNGKFRRPADLWTPNFDVPMRDSLLWVYEGQTQYWGYVLAARSGLLTKQQALDAIAATAATYDYRVGRGWRAMEDTTNDPIIASRRPQSWLSWQRSEDYYSEGQLIWLDADTLIRQLSGGKRSLDDFARAFFGVDNDSHVVRPYDFDEVVATLNGVQPYDWASFLHQRIDGHGPGAPLDGLKRGGYKLTYTDTETDYLKSAEAGRKMTDLSFSIGVTLSSEGTLTQVQWDGPAFKAGLTEGCQIVAVNGDAFSADDLKDAIKAGAASGAAPIELLIKNKDQFRTVRIDYHDGLRYPHLERMAGAPARLDDILTPRK